MAKRFNVVQPLNQVYAMQRIVAAGSAASIDRGTPTKEGSAGAVAIMVDADGTTSQRFSGIAKSVSTDTASAAGVVRVIVPIPELVYSGSPLVAAAANTQSEIDALMGKRVIFDLTSGDWTIDSAQSDSATNTVVIYGGQPEQDLLYFVVSVSGLNLE